MSEKIDENTTSEASLVPPKTKAKGKKQKMKKSEITPEFIAEQRRLREERKEAKRQEAIRNGIDPDQIDVPEYLRYIKRPMLKIHGDKDEENTKDETLDVTIMTYNLLAQALIRRTLFPTNGDALKWSRRSVVLLQELKDYNSDILCLQEVDYIQYNSFWKEELGKLGYSTKYYRSGIKNHGCTIFWKTDKFDCIDTGLIDYDKEETGDVNARTVTTNIGLMVALQLSQKFLSQYEGKTITKINPGILVGTTHLFWHPFGTYERTRQTYIILRKMKEFENRIKVLNPETEYNWWSIIAGDFNSQPFDSPYLSITSKPIEYTDRAERVIACSTSFQYSSLREGGNAEDEEGGNIEKHGENQPKDPVPDEFVATEDQKKLVKQMQDLHNSLPIRAISLYSIAYSKVHPENSGIDNDRNEPLFSNWAHSWRGLLDYIFVVKDWDITKDCKKVDDLNKFENENGLIVKELLRLPTKEEMGEEPSGQPRAGQYPSDHLCMISKIGLKL